MLTLVGTGPVARAFAISLARSGRAIQLLSRDPSRAAELARAVGEQVGGAPPPAGSDAVAALEHTRALLLCVPDRAIEPVAATLAALADGDARIALHTSGYHGQAPLEPLARAGWSTGSLHPLSPLPSSAPEAWRRLENSWFAASGEPAARELALELIGALAGRPLLLTGDERAKHRYHAAAALLSNGLVALFDLALGELTSSGIDREDARRALATLLRSTAHNLAEQPPAEALTGPVPRGDAEVVRGHLASLGGDALAVYRPLLARLLHLARGRGGLGSAELEALERALD